MSPESDWDFRPWMILLIIGREIRCAGAWVDGDANGMIGWIYFRFNFKLGLVFIWILILLWFEKIGALRALIGHAAAFGGGGVVVVVGGGVGGVGIDIGIGIGVGVGVGGVGMMVLGGGLVVWCFLVWWGLIEFGLSWWMVSAMAFFYFCLGLRLGYFLGVGLVVGFLVVLRSFRVEGDIKPPETEQ